jgi:hypothetical protein
MPVSSSLRSWTRVSRSSGPSRPYDRLRQRLRRAPAEWVEACIWHRQLQPVPPHPEVDGARQSTLGPAVYFTIHLGTDLRRAAKLVATMDDRFAGHCVMGRAEQKERGPSRLFAEIEAARP